MQITRNLVEKKGSLSAAGITTATALIAAGVAFIVNILMARQLGPESRGHVAWVLQFAYVTAPIVALGVDREALRGGRGKPNQSHVWVTCGLACMAAALAGSLSVAVCAAAAAVGASVAIQRAVGMAAGSLKQFFTIQLLIQSWTLLATLGLYVFSQDDNRLWLLVYAAPAPALMLYSLRPGITKFNLGVRLRRSSVSRTSFQYMLGGMGSLLAGRVERLLLPAVASAGQLGLYVSVATASELITWGARGLGESRVVGLRHAETSRAEVTTLAIRNAFIFALLAIPLFFAIRFALIPLLGPAFSQASILVAPLCVSSVLWATYLQISSAWLACGTARQSITLDLAAAVMTALFVLLLAPHHGALGAAYACLLSYACMILAALLFFPSDAKNDRGVFSD